MQRDIRETALFRDAESLYRMLRQPGNGQLSDAAEVHVSSDGKHAVFAGAIMDKLDGVPPTRVCQIDLTSAHTQVLTSGPNTDRLPKYSPDGRHIAFLSDRHKVGDFQLYLLDTVSGETRTTVRVDGWVEYLHWSPDGRRVLLGVAGHGADLSGAQGAITSSQTAGAIPSWLPAVETGDESYRWRRAWVYELATKLVSQVGRAESNVWEMAWCGNEAFVAVTSPGPGEGLWYSAHLQIVDLKTGMGRDVYVPADQLGLPSASPSGRHLAIVEAICSDRWLVAGDLRIIETTSGNMHRVDTQGLDITYTEWRSERILLLAGHRGFETVVGIYDVDSQSFAQVWVSQDLSTGGRYIAVSGIDEAGDCALIGESFTRSPEIAVIHQGVYRTVKSLDLGYSVLAKGTLSVERVKWRAPDDLEIQGWLLRPKAQGPHPLIVSIHGGPVWHARPVWLGRGGLHFIMLLQRGFAVFLPNPRGSTGRGQEFARRVLGDMGGADTYDYLSGLDYLVGEGIADPDRLGVTGVSYGGFMASWLITQDSRFAAAVPVAPVTNYVTEYLLSNIPHWPALFLADTYTNLDGNFFSRSPIMQAHKTKTPTLNVCGALDRSAPPEEAVQFHNALLMNGVTSVLVTYPEEGHGIRKLPSLIDFATRVVSWFEEYLPTEHHGVHDRTSKT
jgi:dipeptidyl aminopeptidase/acylaminoacyl peptidase